MLGISKRQREPDELTGDDKNGPRVNKKPRPLALRTSPDSRGLSYTEACQASNRPGGIPTLTPAESSDDDDDGITRTLRHPTTAAVNASRCVPQILNSSAPVFSTTMDVDSIGDTYNLTSNEIPHDWPGSTPRNGSVQPSPIPHNLVNQFLNISGQPKASSIPEHNSAVNPSAQVMDQAFVESTNKIGPPQKLSTESSQKTSGSTQRLPSPISEDDNTASHGKCSTSDAEMTSGASRSTSPALSPFQRDPSQWFGTTESQQQATRSGYPNLPHLNKKKVSFAMGFRADCDKCLRKVPGHYSHIIRN
ncbi:uncharacterized protein P174DRAFT_453743 [Aspergillus novofumigatus IBT 16806]|uniref:Uncharacterized protein n=1 Tax=Aspergillus novofumigatus (strain IBT 16806) TaxID=1392255 RepID=A0A2I1BZP0_ASPN1|nr:uncharacterized protein P174DRAFT_453743 [Aspergillus novofumigatus IBT 16806]PKX90839.1 hypothetical protein P174DRAFT_453743 [Aspergillus novofumigatus IBT 16806]